MSGYWRNIVYLKECNGAEDSLGFGKLECRGEYRKIRIQIRKKSTEPQNWKAYIGIKKGNHIYFSFIGSLEKKEDGYLLTKEEKADKIEARELAVISADGTILCDEKIRKCEFCFEEKVQEEADESKRESKQRMETEQNPESLQVHAAEISLKEETKWFLTLMDKAEEMYPFEDNEWSQCVKLETSDFGMLPAKYWSLGSNSFLLNGYYGYRHLLFAVKEEPQGTTCSLGVPGTYHRREIFMAKMFGFPRFKGVKGKPSPSLGDFGYWMMELEK